MLDIDAVFLNMGRKLETLIPGDKDYSLVVCADGLASPAKDYWHFNAGIMLVQATHAARCLFRDVANADHHHNYPNWEQEAFQELVKYGSYPVKGNTRLYRDQVFRYENHLEFNHRGPFIHHFCGCGSVEERVKLMREELDGAFKKAPPCEGDTP